MFRLKSPIAVVTDRVEIHEDLPKEGARRFQGSMQRDERQEPITMPWDEGSRQEPPAVFVTYCPNRGCNKWYIPKGQLDRHLKNCPKEGQGDPNESVPAPVTDQQDTVSGCPRPQCEGPNPGMTDGATREISQLLAQTLAVLSMPAEGVETRLTIRIWMWKWT